MLFNSPEFLVFLPIVFGLLLGCKSLTAAILEYNAGNST